MSWIAIAASISSIASAVAAWKSSYASRDSAKAANNGILLSQTPYMDVLGPSEFSLSFDKNENNFNIELKNSGNSIARAHEIAMAVVKLDRGQQENPFLKWDYQKNMSGADVFKDDPILYTLTISFSDDKTLNSLQGSEVEVALNVTYSNVIGDALHKRACWIYRISGGKLKKNRNCTFYNDTY